MITTLLTALVLSASVQAAPPASCMGKTGNELAICQEQRMAHQAAEIAAAKRAIDALELQCAQACDNSTPAPAPNAPRTPSGPSRIRMDVTDLQVRVKALEDLLAGGVVTEEEFDRAIAAINSRITTINETLKDHGDRITELERKAADPPLQTPPTYVSGPAGPAGEPGRDGRDGHPAEIAVLIGVDGIHSSEWNIVGGEVTIQVGGRLSDKLRLGGYGNGFVAGANDLGFGAGAYAGFEVTDWFRPSATFGWREVGLDIQTTGSRRSFQGVEVTGTLEFQPVGRWVIDANAGAFVPNGEAAFTGGLSTGFRF